MYTLLTGATGLVGRYLMRDMLINGHQLAVVVRPSKKLPPKERIEQIMQLWEDELGRKLPRPVVFAGNVSEESFGLSDDDKAWIRSHVNTIIHSAAILEFHGEDRAGEPWKTNLGGVKHMINLCRECEILDIHHVSTAYVAGIQDTPAMEDALDVGQTFRNDYEESKFLAEKEVRAIDFADHVTVYRPAVIAGDSVTGYTNTYHGLYLYLRLMAMLIPSIPPDENGYRKTPIRLAITGDERRNLVPVEWISAVMLRIFETEEARGGTYNMAPDEPMVSRDMIKWSGEYFKTTGVEMRGHDFQHDEVSREDDEDQWMFERIARDNMGTYEPYERTDNIFDMTQTKKFASDIVCPKLDRTILHRYIEFGEQDKWGKRKQPNPEVAAWASDIVESAAKVAIPNADAFEFGLDIHGPGGGQFTLSRPANGAVTVIQGLADRNMPTISITMDELQQLQNSNTAPQQADQAMKTLQTLLSGVSEASSVS